VPVPKDPCLQPRRALCRRADRCPRSPGRDTPGDQGRGLRPWCRDEPVRRLRLRAQGHELPGHPCPLLQGHETRGAHEQPRRDRAAALEPDRRVHGRLAYRGAPARRGQAVFGQGAGREGGAPQPDRAPPSRVHRPGQDLGTEGPGQALGQGTQRRAGRPLPRGAGVPALRGQAARDQRARPRLVSPRRRGRREPVVLAAERTAGPGRRRAHLRADDRRGRRRGLQPVARHPLAGLQRCLLGDPVDRCRGGRDLAPGRHLSRQAGRHVLLLDLGRQDRERREQLPRREPAAVPQGRRRPVRRRLAQAPLGSVPLHAGPGAAQARRSGEGQPATHQGDRARLLSAHRLGQGDRHARRHRRQRPDAAQALRPVRLVGDLHDDRRAGDDPGGQARRGPHARRPGGRPRGRRGALP
ncbi:MAG: Stage II sporulation protein D, partial [uncultured Solirubrobacteraceae bacterium]